MPVEDFIIAVFWTIDSLYQRLFPGTRLRTRGFMPKLYDSEVITIEIVGEILGLDTDVAIWRYFRQHWSSLFPRLNARTTFVKQAAALWGVKEKMRAAFADELGAFKERIHLIDGLPIPVCKSGRASQCRRFAGEASWGYCAAKKEYYYGFHGHLVAGYSGLVTEWTVTAANGSEREALWEMTGNWQGLLLGDKGYLSEALHKELLTIGINLQTAFRNNMQDTRPPSTVSELISMRRKIETVIGQLSERFHIERVWARDKWHFTSRIVRKLLAHTVCFWLNVMRSSERPLQFEGLIVP